MVNDKEKIRLLYFHPTIVFGGAERTSATLLDKIDKSVFDVIFVTKKGIFHSLPVSKVIYIDDLGISDGFCSFRKLIKDTKVMLKLIEEENPSVVFGMLHYACIVLSLLKVFSRKKAKIVISPRTPSKDAINFYFKNRAIEKMRWRFMVRFFCRHSDSIIVTSKGLQNECVHKYKAKKNKVFIINNCVDWKLVDKLSMEHLHSEGSGNRLVISTACRLDVEKNLPVLIKAFALLRREISAKLWIIGDGPERPRLESLSAGLNMKDDVVFWGFKENPYKYIKRSDVFVHTSLFEGFGNTIIEAMACGIPVVATDCPFGPSEIINNMENGILVPVSDEFALMQALKTVLEGKKMGNNFIEKAYKRVSDFSAETMVAKYEEVFLKVLNRPYHQS